MSLARFRSFAVAAALLAPTVSVALTISGNIAGEVTWRRADSPISVTQLVTVERGAKLTIEAGVAVHFDGVAGMIVLGDLIARGGPSDSIYFTSSEDRAPGSWGGIYLRRADAPPAYDNTGAWTGVGSVLDYCVIEGGGSMDVEGGSALGFRGSSPLVAHSSIRGNSGITGAIRVLNSAQPLIFACRIEGNRATRGGAISSGVGSKPTIRDCFIIGNKAVDNGGAIYVSLADALLEGNLIAGNQAGSDGGAIFAARVSDLTLTNNTFLENQQSNASGVIYVTERVSVTAAGNSFDGAGSFFYLKAAALPISTNDDWWGAAPVHFSFSDAVRDQNDDRSEPLVTIASPRWAPPDFTPGTPSAVSQIILCRTDDYADEILRGVADGAPLRIRLTGVDVDPAFADVIPVRVVSTLDPTGIMVPLKETGPSTGIYTGRAAVANSSDQSRYVIGDRIGGEVTIFSPAHPTVKAVYKTLPAKPVAYDFTISDVPDLNHLTTHSPNFVWSYFEVVDRPQKSYKIEVTGPDGKVWSTGEIVSGSFNTTYAGNELEEGTSYQASLEVWSGKFWSEPITVEFRMNSLPTAPDLTVPTEQAIVPTRTPKLAATPSTDREGDALTYRIEVVNTAEEVLQQADKLTASAVEVAWTPQPLAENGFFEFRWQASDPFEDGPWSSYRSFSVNSVEEAPAAFDLSSPVSGSVYELHPTLTWNSALDPDPSSSVIYTVEIAKNANWASGRTYSNLASTDFLVPDSLDNRSEYSWRVTATDNTGRKTVSTRTGKFYVETTPSVPALIAPLTSADERKSEAALSWSASTDPNPNDVITYEVEVFVAGAEAKTLASKIGWSGTEIPVSSLAGWESLGDNKVYAWRARARDNHNAASEFSKIGNFFFNKVNDVPTAPTAVTAPGDTVKGTTSVRFAWQAGSDADLSDPATSLTYEIEAVVGQFDGADVRRFNSNAGANELTANLDDNKLWNYRIRTVDDDGATSPWVAARKVLVNVEEDPPSTFSLIEPTDVAAIAELDSLRFSWGVATDPDWASSVRYRFELTDAAGKTFRSETGQTTILYKGGLANESRYSWKVFAIDNTGRETVSASEFSYATNTTPTMPGAPDLPIEMLPAGRFTFAPASDPNPRDRLAYTVEIGASGDFAPALLKKDGIQNNPSQISVGINEFVGWDKLQDDKDYFIRIRTIDNHGIPGAFTSAAKFRYNKENDTPTIPTAPFSPTGNEVVTDRSPVVKWSASSDEDLTDPASSLVYDIRLDSDGEIIKGAMYEFTTQPGAAEFRIPVQLADNTPWVWAVRSRDDGGAVSGWTTIQSFLLNQREDPPTAPNLIRPYNAQTMNVLGPINFGWSRATDPDYKSSVKYRLVYGTSADLTGATNVDNLADSSYKVAGPLENTIYYWRVIAIDNTGLETASQTISFTLDTRPTPPQPALPSGGVELKPDGRFGWSSSTDPNPADVITYTIQIASGADFGEILCDAKGLKETGLAFNMLPNKAKLTDNQSYYWRIKASDNHAVESSWSDAAAFVLNLKNDPPSAFNLISPSNGGKEPIAPVMFKWATASDPDPNSRITYSLVIAKDAKFTDGVQKMSITATEMQLPAASFTPGGSYFWKVTAEDGLGGASFGSDSDRTPWSFTIETPPPPTPPQEPTTPTGGSPGN